MIRGAVAPVFAGIRLVDPSADTPVIPAGRLRPGIDLARVSVFGDRRWILSDMEHKQTGETKFVDWDTFPEAFQASVRRIGWAVINIETPDVLLRRARTTSRPLIAAGTVHHAAKAWREFTRWLVQRQVTGFDQVDRAVMEDFASMIAAKGRTYAHDRNVLLAITRIWAYAPFLLPQDRLVMPPWDDPGAELTDFLGENDGGRGENTTEVIHPATMSPLLVWSLRVVTDLAPDILAAIAEHRRLLACIPASVAGPARDVLERYFADLRETGRPIPVYAGSVADRRAKATLARTGHDQGQRPGVNQTFIAGTLGIHKSQVANFMRDNPEAWAGLEFGSGAFLDIPVTGRIDGKRWTDGIDFAEVKDLTLHLVTATLVVIAYLSGMRQEEVLHLERGCAHRETRGDGTIRYRVNGRHFKGVTDEDGNTVPEGEMRPEPWTVIELVHRAIEAVEQAHGETLLFPSSISKQRRPSAHHGEAIRTGWVKVRIGYLMAWANGLAAAHGRDHEVIPPDPHDRLTLGRFRRTVAWFIYRRPGGRIALGLQYGHVGSSMGESYGSRSKFDMLSVLDFEESLAVAETLAEAGDRLDAGEGVSGPAAGRYLAAAQEFRAAYGGGFLTRRQHTALKANPRLRVYESENALLTCNLDPFKALCDPDLGRGNGLRTPSFNRCNPACTNISRTDTHIERAQAEKQQLAEELADGLNPQPVALRLEQRIEKLDLIIESHGATRHQPALTTEEA